MDDTIKLEKCPITHLTVVDGVARFKYVPFDAYYYRIQFEGESYWIGLCYHNLGQFLILNEEVIDKAEYLKHIGVFLGAVANSNYSALFNRLLHWNCSPKEDKNIKSTYIKPFSDNWIQDRCPIPSSTQKKKWVLESLQKLTTFDGEEISLENNFRLWSSCYLKNPKELDFYISELVESGLVKLVNKKACLTLKASEAPRVDINYNATNEEIFQVDDNFEIREIEKDEDFEKEKETEPKKETSTITEPKELGKVEIQLPKPKTLNISKWLIPLLMVLLSVFVFTPLRNLIFTPPSAIEITEANEISEYFQQFTSESKWSQKFDYYGTNQLNSNAFFNRYERIFIENPQFIKEDMFATIIKPEEHRFYDEIETKEEWNEFKPPFLLTQKFELAYNEILVFANSPVLNAEIITELNSIKDKLDKLNKLRHIFLIEVLDSKYRHTEVNPPHKPTLDERAKLFNKFFEQYEIDFEENVQRMLKLIRKHYQ